MPSDDPGWAVNRLLGWLAFIGQSAAIISAAAKLTWGGAEAYRGFSPWVFVSAFGILSLWSLSDALRGSSRRRGTKAYVIVSLAALVAHLGVWDPIRARSLPAFDNTAAVAVGLSFLVLPRAAAMLYVAMTQVVYALLLPPALGGVWTVWIVATTAIAGLVCLVARLLIDESIARMRSSRDLAAEAETLEDKTALRAQALNSWLDVVHREIIGTLLPSSRGAGASSSTIRARAEAALKALTAFHIPPSEEGFKRFVQKSARVLDLVVYLEQEGDWQAGGPQAPLRGCISEALANVQRHAGTRAARITAVFQPLHWVVTISDDGKGFDTEVTGKSRSHGLDVSLRAPWTAAGGRVVVASTPGSGTAITLTWEGLPRQLDAWSSATLRWLSALVTLSLSLHVGMGWLAGGYSSPIALLVGELTIILATLMAFYAPRWDALGLVLLFGAEVVLAANIAPTSEADLRTWFAGAITGAVGVMAFRGRWKSSLAMVLASWGAASWIMPGGSLDILVLGRLLGSYLGPMLAPVFAYVGAFLRRVDRDQQIQRARRAATQRHAAEVRASLERWDSENAPLVDFVTPLLTELTAIRIITADLAEECRAREACCRDYLRSPGLVDQHLLTVTFDARRRGCEIVLDVPAPPDEPLLSGLRSALADAIRILGVTSLTLTRIPGAPMTMVVKGDGPSMSKAAAAVSDRLRRDCALTTLSTHLETAVLLEIAD